MRPCVSFRQGHVIHIVALRLVSILQYLQGEGKYNLFMEKPIVRLKLNPRCCQQIQCCRGYELFPCHENIGKHSRTWGHHLLFRWFRRILSGEISTETLASAAHQWHRGRIELAIGIARVFEACAGQRFIGSITLNDTRGITILQIVLSQFYS